MSGLIRQDSLYGEIQKAHESSVSMMAGTMARFLVNDKNPVRHCRAGGNPESQIFEKLSIQSFRPQGEIVCDDDSKERFLVAVLLEMTKFRDLNQGN